MEDGVFNVTVTCLRVPLHEYTFVFKMHNRVLTKIGQWPSMADIANADLNQYRAILPC